MHSQLYGISYINEAEIVLQRRRYTYKYKEEMVTYTKKDSNGHKT